MKTRARRVLVFFVEHAGTTCPREKLTDAQRTPREKGKTRMRKLHIHGTVLVRCDDTQAAQRLVESIRQSATSRNRDIIRDINRDVMALGYPTKKQAPCNVIELRLGREAGWNKRNDAWCTGTSALPLHKWSTPQVSTNFNQWAQWLVENGANAVLGTCQWSIRETSDERYVKTVSLTIEAGCLKTNPKHFKKPIPEATEQAIAAP